MQNGLNFNGNIAHSAGKAIAQQADRTTGKFVLKDLSATAEVFSLISVSANGVKGSMSVKLQSTYNGAIYVVGGFWEIRPAFPNEVQANSRQGSDQFSQFWATNSHQYY